MKVREIRSTGMGCALTVASSVAFLFSGVMVVGALVPEFAYLALEVSGVALIAALALIAGQVIFIHFGID